MRSWFETRVHPIGIARRFVLASIGLALVAATFHSWVSASLVGRGDDLVRAGDPKRAMRYFERASQLDPGWRVPVERLGFAATLLGERLLYRKEIQLATRYLARHPGDIPIRWDRAVAYVHLHEHAAAYRDIARIVREQPKNVQMRDVAKRLAARSAARL